MFRLGLLRPSRLYRTRLQSLRIPSRTTRSYATRPQPPSTPNRSPTTSRDYSHWILLIGIGLPVAFSVFHVFTEYFFSPGEAYGISMLPTIASSGDWLLISKYYRRGRGLGVGDIVCFQNPVRVGESGVKRIIGMPGDFVERDTPGTNSVMIQVPEGHCWVVGDNLTWSRDSRMYGPLPLALVTGKVLAKMSSRGSMQWIKHGLSPASDVD